MQKKVISILLVAAIILGNFPVFRSHVLADSPSGSDSDVFSALGIDTNKAPKGYDSLSTDNPYGKDVIEIAPVYELFTVGLNEPLNYVSAFEIQTSEIHTGEKKQLHTTEKGNQLSTTLYGHEKWDMTSNDQILSNPDKKSISGLTYTQGNYTLISSDTVKEGNESNLAKGYLAEPSNAYTVLNDNFIYALSSVAAGNFDGNSSGLSAQIVMVYTTEYSKNSGLYLRFRNAVSGEFGNNAITLLDKNKDIGNPDLADENGHKIEDFARNPYQLRNYLKVTTGDWNGDGIDEVAVYIPEKGNSRIAVYALQLTSGDDKGKAYLDASKWKLVWTYYLREGNIVSNMVSLVSGDVNKDGIDDLAATWGYYYGPDKNIGSTAVVMFGAKGTAMLNKSQQFDLKHGSSNIVRGTFVFGDIMGGNSDVLILCGQSDADLKNGNQYTRYVALYHWNGSEFTSTLYQNFDLFEIVDGEYRWPAMAENRTGNKKDKFFTLPLCPANVTLIQQGVGSDPDLLYFDSLIIEYTDNGLNIREAWDITSYMQSDVNNCIEYVEYGAVAGDIAGQTGSSIFFTMIQTLYDTAERSASFKIEGSMQVPKYELKYYYKNWLHWLFDIRTYYYEFAGYDEITTSDHVTAFYSEYISGNAYMIAVDPFNKTGNNYYCRKYLKDYSTSFCLANTDNDSVYMNYTGRHYYIYSDPQILAVLASPPYFNDLMNRDDLSGSYAESCTSYSSTEGHGSGDTATITIKAGVYVAYEQEVSFFGIKGAQVEAETQVTCAFTWEMEIISTLEQSVSYTAVAGEDMVAFYSIPLEIYEYETFVPDGKGNYKKVLTTVNIPHEAAIRLMPLDEYAFIAKDYSALPQIADNVLTHTLGDPATYPSSSSGYDVIAEYKGTPSAVGFSAVGGSITQEIAMSYEEGHAFVGTIGIETKFGGGAGGWKAGIVAGAEGGAGYVTISTSGSSFSGELYNMPIEAQPYGYGMNWKIFCYKYNDGKLSFPVVSYIVSDVSSPPQLPRDFAQDVSRSTSDSVVLTWSYDKTIAGFKIYRYFEFPDGAGSYEIAFVPFNAAERYDEETGTYYFSFTDTNLSPYTDYYYQIKAVRAANPKESIYSQPIVCRTKTEVGYPVIRIEGLEDGMMPVYPDADSTVVAVVENPEAYKALDYRWQKLVDGQWANLAITSNELTISNAGTADIGSYRCRVNAIYYDENTGKEYYISAYSEVITTAYFKRTPTCSLFTAKEVINPGDDTIRGLKASIELHSANTNHIAAPAGNVTFTVSGTDYKYSETVPPVTSQDTKLLGGIERRYSSATLEIPELPAGVYTVTAYYAGSRVFKDLEIKDEVLVVIGEASDYRLSLSASPDGDSVTQFVYGDIIYPKLEKIEKSSEGVIRIPVSENIKYMLFEIASATESEFAAGSKSPNVGGYTLRAVSATTPDSVYATCDFEVRKKPVTIYVENRTDVSSETVEENLPGIYSHDLTDYELDALDLDLIAFNSAGNMVQLKNGMDPGNYTVHAAPPVSVGTDYSKLYNNYSITFVPGTFTVIGATYRLKVVAADYTDQSGTRPVGTAGIGNMDGTEAYYSAGTQVLLYAVPNAGYQVDTWTAVYENGYKKTQEGSTTFTLTTEAQNVTVTVTFRPALLILRTSVIPGDYAGLIECSDPTFSSGAIVSYGAEFDFTATPSEGYHFRYWQVLSDDGTIRTYPGTPGDNGTNSINISVGTKSLTVYAVFERDSYKLTLDGNITAYYWHDHDNDVSTPVIKKFIESGSLVVGDTEIHVIPRTGYQAAEGAYFVVNGNPTEENEEYVFNITQDTTVFLETVRNKYKVTILAQNGSVSMTVNGVPVSPDENLQAEGGSELKFTARADEIPSGNLQFGGSVLEFYAHPADGYMVDYWTVNDEPAKDVNGNIFNSPILVVDPLKEQIAVRVFFTELKLHHVKLTGNGEMGESVITYVTPLSTTDDGIRLNLQEEYIRDKGTVKMTFKHKDGYGTDAGHLENVIRNSVTTDAAIFVKEINKDDVVCYEVTVGNLIQGFELEESDIYYKLHNITVPEGVTASTYVAKAGDTIILTVTPPENHKLAGLTLDNGTLNEPVSADLLTYSFIMPPSDVTVNVEFELVPPENGDNNDNDDNGGSGGPGGGGPIVIPDDETLGEKTSVQVFAGENSIEVNATVSDGLVRPDIDIDTLMDLLAFPGKLQVDLSSVEDIAGAVLTADVFKALSDSDGTEEFSVRLPDAELTFDRTAFEFMGDVAADEITLRAVRVNKENLTEEQKALVGDRPVIDITVEADGKSVTGLNGGIITVKIPYTLKPGENPEAVVVWYLNDKGILEPVTGQYDYNTGSVTFTVNHLSMFVIGYLPFEDVDRESWYFDSVSFVYANGLFFGTGSTTFSPEDTMTRAMLVTVLWRLEGKPEAKGNPFTDVPAGEWYTEAIAWAAENKIVLGYGNGLFGPDDPVTREQMALILMNYAIVKGYDSSAAADLRSFADWQETGTGARKAMGWAIAENIIVGTGDGRLEPKGPAKRCQVAAILQRFTSKFQVRFSL